MYSWKKIQYSFYLILVLSLIRVSAFRKYSKNNVMKLREEVREMFTHAYDSYLRYAYPYDELRPLSCDGFDTWGSYSLTLIDALDTLAVMGNFSEFRRVVEILTSKPNFDANINVSVFETNIRIVGGLLSAHLLSYRSGVDLEPGWPCNGPLLRLAEDVARRLLPAFDTPTGMPYGTVNLRYGVPPGETTITCTAAIGSFILEFGTLSRLTGDPVYEEVAMNALYALRHYRSSIGLVGNHIDVATGRWTAQDAGIGAGVDSYYEYLAKGAVLLQKPELIKMFEESRVAIDRHLKRDDWHLWVTMTKGQVTLPVFQSLEAYWPGLLSLVGDVSAGMKSLHNYHQVWKQYGFTPEFYNIPQGEAGANREGYPLRPELVESVMYLSRATGDPFLFEVGVDILSSIQHSARTSCGYATIKDTRDHRLDDRMESFFLAETTKYLYLLFDPENFIHNRGQHGSVVKTHWGECIMEAGGYIFNTEAHPFDAGALHCCSEARDRPFILDLDAFRGETLVAHQQRLERQRQNKERQMFWTKHIKENIQKTEKPVVTSSVITSSMEKEETSNSDKSPLHTETSSLNSVNVKQEEVAADSQSQVIGVGEVVNVQWHAKNEDSFVWHTKEETSGNSASDRKAEKESEKAAESNSGKIIGYRAEKNRITPIMEGEGPVSSAPFNFVNSEEKEIEDPSNPSEKSPECEMTKDSQNPPKLNEPPIVTVVPSLSSVLDTLFALREESEIPPKKPFDPQDLLMRIRHQSQYFVNSSWESEFSSLSCSLQPFLQRVSMSGEFFSSARQTP